MAGIPASSASQPSGHRRECGNRSTVSSCALSGDRPQKMAGTAHSSDDPDIREDRRLNTATTIGIIIAATTADMLRATWHRVLVFLLLCMLLLTAPGAMAEPAKASARMRELVGMLHSGDAAKRRAAARELSQQEGPSLVIVPFLLKVVEREPDPITYRYLLRALGKSGAMEARPAIDRHILSPDKTLRDPAREALRDWLWRNGLIGRYDELPYAPHPLYGAPPPLPPTVPAGHTLRGLLNAPDGHWTSRPSQPRPVYLPPAPGQPWAAVDDSLQVASGFRASWHPKSGPLIGGGLTLGASYLAAAIGALRAAANDDDRYAPLAIPVAGPFITLFTASSFAGSRENCPDFCGIGHGLLGLLFIADGVTQVLGVTLISVGLGMGETEVVRDQDAAPPTTRLQVSARLGSMHFGYRF